MDYHALRQMQDRKDERLNSLTWEQYALNIAETVAQKSKDPYVKVGAVLLRYDNSVASVGYNGFPSGMIEDWSNRDERRKYVVHAEKNALRYVKPNECYLAACTLLPCNDCLKDLAAYGIKKLVFKNVYTFDFSTLDLANKFGIELIQLN